MAVFCLKQDGNMYLVLSVLKCTNTHKICLNDDEQPYPIRMLQSPLWSTCIDIQLVKYDFQLPRSKYHGWSGSATLTPALYHTIPDCVRLQRQTSSLYSYS